MKTVHNWEDLAHFGIRSLTGEACGVGIRMLCDVTAQGRDLLAKFLGVPELKLADDYNNGPAVGSLMLPYSVFHDLVAFALLSLPSTLAACYVKGEGVLAMETTEEVTMVESDISQGFMECVRWYQKRGTGHDGTRNVHVMSGREE